MSNGSVRIIAYTLAALLLIALSRIWPSAAAWLAIATTVGVALSNSDQFTALAGRVAEAFGDTFGVAKGGPIQFPNLTNPHQLQQ